MIITDVNETIDGAIEKMIKSGEIKKSKNYTLIMSCGKKRKVIIEVKGKPRRIRISSSIANFHERLRARYSDYEDFKWFSHDDTIFFGMYHVGDFLRLICHQGRATVFFCGSDILQLPKWMVPVLKRVRNVCENVVEFRKLQELGIEAETHPMLFDDPDKYQVTYEHSDTPQVWITAHPGRKNEYGYTRLIEISKQVPGVLFHVFTDTPRDEFLRETAKMQATIRLNEFDGFSENLALAMLRGQYAFSVIPYPDIETITSDAKLVEALKDLKNKHQPHESSYWRERLSKRVEV